ncbi:hypothetical protein PIB30_058287 [Stylosanthes scabra]|uniref:Uncharacterized protein n=1 Tax=Stylosanthes scabra TaxID=79078 RepID=A0ABU6XHU8_9FABA|nr:hypothetical protein [Stylosanthes scabra]
MSIRIMWTNPGPSLAAITIGESESAKPCTKSSLLKVIIGNRGGGIQTVARTFKSFLRDDLDFSKVLEPVMTCDLHDRIVVISAVSWVPGFWPWGFFSVRRPSFREDTSFQDLLINLRNGSYQQGIGCVFVHYPGEPYGLGVHGGCYYLVDLFMMYELLGNDLHLLPRPHWLGRQLLSNKVVVCETVCENSPDATNGVWLRRRTWGRADLPFIYPL